MNNKKKTIVLGGPEKRMSVCVCGGDFTVFPKYLVLRRIFTGSRINKNLKTLCKFVLPSCCKAMATSQYTPGNVVIVYRDKFFVVVVSEPLTGDGHDYRGGQTQTINGHTCQQWNLQEPNSHNVSLAADGIGPHNYCRNPNPNEADTIWCYTVDGPRWEYCSPIGGTISFILYKKIILVFFFRDGYFLFDNHGFK